MQRNAYVQYIIHNTPINEIADAVLQHVIYSGRIRASVIRVWRRLTRLCKGDVLLQSQELAARYWLDTRPWRSMTPAQSKLLDSRQVIRKSLKETCACLCQRSALLVCKGCYRANYHSTDCQAEYVLKYAPVMVLTMAYLEIGTGTKTHVQCGSGLTSYRQRQSRSRLGICMRNCDPTMNVLEAILQIYRQGPRQSHLKCMS